MDVVSLLCSTPTRPRLQSIVPPSRRTRIAIASIGGHSPRKAAVSRPRIVSLMQSSTSSTSSIPPGDALVLVPGDGVAAPSRWLAPFCAALDSERSVWLWFGDLTPSAPLPDTVLPALSAACSAAARAGKPMADFVPLVPRLAAQGGGEVWKVLGGGRGGGGGGDDDEEDEGEAAAPSSSPPCVPLSLASVLVGSEEQREQASALARRIERAQKSPFSVAVVIVAAEPRSAFPASLPVPAAAAAAAAAPQTTAAEDAPSPPPFDQVAVGGTFDRLHAGHRLLLAASALAAERRLFIGITGDKLLSSKKHPELLQPFGERANAAVAFARKVRPGERVFAVDVGALLDPKEPTGAETEPGMQALVVSKETVSGGEAINAGRKQRGFRPLALLVVGLVGSSSEGGQGGQAHDEEPEGKISSTDLRAAEAAKKETGEGK